jgi:aminoglycoside 3-N-acetyltransferase
MTEGEARQALESLLREIQVTRGEVIYLGIDMSRLPLPFWPSALNREAMHSRGARWCAFVYDCIMDVIGPEGTLLVGTFTYSCGASTFIVEQTPSELGPFTNWLRIQPKAIRSLHPVFSVAGIGAKALEILTDTGGAAFGPCSPFGRIASLGGRFVNLGIPFRQSLTYVHHLEQCFGCNHRYHKIFSATVIQNGCEVDRDFSGYMRWRGVDAAVDVAPLEDALKRAGVLLEVDRPRLFGQSAKAADIDRIGYSMLSKDSCAFSTRKVRVDLDDSAVAGNLFDSPAITFKLSV